MTLPSNNTIPGFIDEAAEHNPHNIAFLAPNRESLTFHQLKEHIHKSAGILNACGIQRQERVAILVPDGPDLATAFIVVSSVATAIPFNLAAPQDELRTLFVRTKITAIILQRTSKSTFQSETDDDSDAKLLNLANELNLNVIELTPTQRAGEFTLYSPRIDQDSETPLTVEFAHPDDICQIAFTSGTTSAAKIVPTLHQDHVERARAALRQQPITTSDRLLNVMPLYHPAGLNHIVRSLGAGGSVVCMSGFEVPRFYAMLDEYKPTWFSAVATFCQMIVDRAPDYQDIIARTRLLYIRAGSMALPPELMQKMEATFGVPILQAYGASETGLIAASGISPSTLKVGSVGKPLNLTVEILDDEGNKVAVKSIGEIVASGETLFKGYIDDPQATNVALRNGKYYTGDLGYFDEEGFLFITGRVKEVVNRGGQKISPAEIEDLLSNQPAVKQAVVFGIPHPQLGEELGVAVVLHPDKVLTSDQVVSTLSAKLALYKVPRYVVFTDTIPVNALGKVQRKSPANHFGLPATDSSISTAKSNGVTSPVDTPSTDTVRQLMQAWSEVLNIPFERVGIHDKFQNIGGSSLSSVRLVFKVRSMFNLPITILDFFNAPTIAEQARIVDEIRKAPVLRPHSTLTPIRIEGSNPPLYCLHALKGNVYFYKPLLPYLEPTFPLYGLQAVGVDDGQDPLETVDAIARYHHQQIIEVQRKGPYFLCGYSFGGRLALEIGRLLRAQGHTDVYVCIIDDLIQVNKYAKKGATPQRLTNIGIVRQLHSVVLGTILLPSKYRKQYLRQKRSGMRAIWRVVRGMPVPKIVTTGTEARQEAELPPTILRAQQASRRAAQSYVPVPYEGDITYIRGEDNGFNIELFKTLRYLAKGKLNLVDVPGSHDTIMRTDQVAYVAKAIQDWINSASLG